MLGKKNGTTSLTLYDRSNMLIAVVDVIVGPDVITLKRQLSELMPGDQVGARISNDAVILEGIVASAPAADRAVQIAETYAPGKVVNLLSIGSAQQVMLEVRFSEVKRSALKQIGFGFFVGSDGGKFNGAIGGGASLSPGTPVTSTIGGVTTTTPGDPILALGSITNSFGIISRAFRAFGTNFEATLDALERKGAITTLAEPTLVALSGETASFLAGGEFPVPVVQSSGGGTGGGNSQALTIEWKPFGVSLAFTPTVLADGVINMVVAPGSQLDRSYSVDRHQQSDHPGPADPPRAHGRRTARRQSRSQWRAFSAAISRTPSGSCRSLVRCRSSARCSARRGSKRKRRSW